MDLIAEKGQFSPKRVYRTVAEKRGMVERILEGRLSVAQVDTIRLKLFKIGAIVRISVRRILLQLTSTYPWKDIFAQAFHALRC